MTTTTLDQRELERVRQLMEQPHAVFVFGSNRSGVHGAGAAREAVERYGAEWGVGEGMTGRCYALPTKDRNIRTLPIGDVAAHVTTLLTLVRTRSDLVFAVTRVGCGLAGFTDVEIAPLFADAPENCELPEGWRELAAEVAP